jgi:hypothetical protein
MNVERGENHKTLSQSIFGPQIIRYKAALWRFLRFYVLNTKSRTIVCHDYPGRGYDFPYIEIVSDTFLESVGSAYVFGLFIVIILIDILIVFIRQYKKDSPEDGNTDQHAKLRVNQSTYRPT